MNDNTNVMNHVLRKALLILPLILLEGFVGNVLQPIARKVQRLHRAVLQTLRFQAGHPRIVDLQLCDRSVG